VGHRLQRVYVVHFQPPGHHPLYAGLGEASEPLDDLVFRAGNSPSRDPASPGTFELAVYVGPGAPEYYQRHQGSLYVVGNASGLSRQFVETGIEVRELLGCQVDGVPLVGLSEVPAGVTLEKGTASWTFTTVACP
jgi:hypothetical protein